MGISRPRARARDVDRRVGRRIVAIGATRGRRDAGARGRRRATRARCDANVASTARRRDRDADATTTRDARGGRGREWTFRR